MKLIPLTPEDIDTIPGILAKVENCLYWTQHSYERTNDIQLQKLCLKEAKKLSDLVKILLPDYPQLELTGIPGSKVLGGRYEYTLQLSDSQTDQSQIVQNSLEPGRLTDEDLEQMLIVSR